MSRTRVGVRFVEKRVAELPVDTNMSDLTEMTPVIERGLSLHKMIRYAIQFRRAIASLTCFFRSVSSSIRSAARAILTSKATNSDIPR